MNALSRRSIIAAALLLGTAPARSQPVPTGPVTLELFGLASHNWQLVIDRFQAPVPEHQDQVHEIQPRTR